MTPESLSQRLSEFLTGARGAVVLEDGVVSFDLASARYSISGEYNKCLLHLWSAERNVVRRVLDVEAKSGSLRLAVQRMGQTRPSKLEICRDRDRRSPSARRAARSAYQQKLRRMLERRFYGFTISELSTRMDLERSFGPVYARGLLKKGQTVFAVLGVNEQESQASVDAALTFGILWLNACRESQNDRAVVEGLYVFVPPKSSGIVRERMAHLNRSAAKWQLFEFDERHDVIEIDCSDCGNVATRLARCPNYEQAYERFAGPIATVKELLPECDAVVLSPAEIAFRLHGLELARARIAHSPTSFHSGTEIVFGLGAEERVLEGRNRDDFVRLLHSAGEVRHADLSSEKPLLVLVAPALRVHPATDVLLRYVSSEIEWEFLGIDERWRDGVRVVFRKRAGCKDDPRMMRFAEAAF